MDIQKFIPLELLLSNKNVDDKDVSQYLARREGISPDLALPYDEADVKFNAHAEGALTVELFNDLTDHTNQQGNADKTMKYWPCVSDVYGAGALMGYTLGGKLKATASGSIGKFDLGVDMEQSLELKSYRFHPKGTSIKKAFLQDLASFKTIFSKSDVLGLAKDEALSYQAAGKLEIGASVKISDVYSGTASIVSGLLNLNGKVKVKVEAAASISFKVAIEDTFQVSIIRTRPCNEDGAIDPAQEFKVVVGKVIRRQAEVGAKAGITAGIEDAEEVKKLVDQLFESVDEIVLGKINALLQKAKLTEEHLDLVRQAALLLGWQDVASVADFKKVYADKKKQAIDKLVEVAATKVEVGISYEYKIIETSESLFTAYFSSAGIDTHYKKIVQLKINDLLAIANGPDFKLVQFFKRDTKEWNSSFGILFALGKFKISVGTKKTFKETKELIKAEDSRMKVSAYNRETTKTFKYGAIANEEYAMRFNADMPVFVNEVSQLTADKFDFEFGLSAEITDKKLSKQRKELFDAVDWAVTWDIIDQSQFQDVFDRILNDVVSVDNHIIKYRFFISVADTASGSTDLFDLLLPKLATASNGQFASALAAAVPYADYGGTSSAKRVRQDIKLRREKYFSFWFTYLQKFYKSQRENSPDFFSTLVGDELSKFFTAQQLEDLANFEASPQQYPVYMGATLQNILFTNFVGQDVDAIRNGFGALNDAVTKHLHYSKSFQQFAHQASLMKFSREFNLRFIGRLILDMAADLNIKSQINRGFSIAYQDGEKDKTYVIS